MAQFPPVKLKVHPSTFDLMMTILEHNTAAEDVQTRNNAQDLMEKRMRFTRLYPGRDGKPCASIQMYESEAAEMIWQLLYACIGACEVEKEYSAELKEGGEGDTR